MEPLDLINGVSAIAQLAMAIIMGIATWIIFKLGERQTSTYECDSIHMEITKTMIADSALLDFYAVGNAQEQAEWSGMSDRDKKLYVLCEMHYFHFAFVYREYQQGRVSEGYWRVYQNWLEKLIASNATFREVHDDNHDLFGEEGDFAAMVEGLLVPARA